MTTVDNDFGPKKPNYFECILCDFKCCYKKDYERHINTIKHKNNALTTNDNAILPKFTAKHYTCKNCEKMFNDRAGLWRHKKKCIETENVMHLTDEPLENISVTGMFMELMKQNQEFQKLIVEQNKQIIELSKEKGITNNCSINNNSNNKTFNLQVFLNEKCKDALNIDEFIDSLKISLTDLEILGETGFVNGVSQIFVNGLRNLDVYKRPIHCSDLKREILYLKQQNVWGKDNNNKDGFKKIVKMIAYKNMLKVKDWKEKYPDYKDDSSKRNDQYLKILIGAAGPHKKEDEEGSYNKIIKNVAKEVIIDKQTI